MIWKQETLGNKNMNHFTPYPLLRNRHVQSIVNSIKLRRPLVVHRAKGMLDAAVSHILDCGDGVRLHGCYSAAARGKNGLCVLIHGWEGSSDSLYLLSAAGFLWKKGFDVFRLNMRDHGPSHHLNEGLFHSCRIQEVVNAVKRVQTTFPHKRMFLAGFSLGGNFALRVAVRSVDAGIRLDHVAAVCPVLYPPSTMAALENGLQIYHLYFLRKWRKSLWLKRKHFPHLKGLDCVAEFKSISSMTDYFVRHFTEFPDLMTYLKGYAITGEALSGLSVPATIIASLDDPIIPAEDLKRLATPAQLSVQTTRYGGHCGFLMDFRLTSWVDQQLAELCCSQPE